MAKFKTMPTMAAAVLAVFGGLSVFKCYSNVPHTAQLAMDEFYFQQVAEDQMMDPLILASSDVVPLILKEVAKPDMPNRRYAIAALGIRGNKAALPVLERIALRKSEVDYLRCDALISVGMVDYLIGLRVFNSVKQDALPCLSGATDENDYAAWLRSNSPSRTYIEALLGWHH